MCSSVHFLRFLVGKNVLLGRLEDKGQSSLHINSQGITTKSYIVVWHGSQKGQPVQPVQPWTHGIQSSHPLSKPKAEAEVWTKIPEPEWQNWRKMPPRQKNPGSVVACWRQGQILARIAPIHLFIFSAFNSTDGGDIMAWRAFIKPSRTNYPWTRRSP